MDDDILNNSSQNLEIFENASSDVSGWIETVEEEMNCKSWKDCTVEKFMRKNKETLAKTLLTGYKAAYSYTEVFKDTTHLSHQIVKLKSQLIEAQQKVIQLQQQLIDSQSEQMNSVTTVVDKAVEKGIQSYSQAVSKSIPESIPSLTEETLKKVVKDAVSDEDRSRNIMVFGMTEEKGENVQSKVTAMFEEISERPSFEAARIGMESNNKIRPRPVKVSFRNGSTVHQILVKAKELKSSPNHRSVYIAPDRSPDERAKHRELIDEVKRRAKEDHSKHYYVRSGRILSRDKD